MNKMVVMCGYMRYLEYSLNNSLCIIVDAFVCVCACEQCVCEWVDVCVSSFCLFVCIWKHFILIVLFHVHMHTNPCTYTLKPVHMYIQSHAYKHSHMHTCIYKLVQMHSHMHMHTHMVYTHIKNTYK